MRTQANCRDFSTQAFHLALQLNKQTTDALLNGTVCVCTHVPYSTRRIALAMKNRALERNAGSSI